MYFIKSLPYLPGTYELSHWGQVRHICICDVIIIGSDNGLSPGRNQAIIWTNAGILLIGPLGTFKNKNGVKRQNTLGCLDQWMCKVLRLWNNQDRETV